jgi:hypothetical protein
MKTVLARFGVASASARRATTCATLAVALVGLGAGATLGGCSGKSAGTPVSIEPAAYDGPSVVMSAGTRNHMTVLTAPTGGWGVTLDTVRDAFNTRRVFVTAIKPGDGDLVSQAMVEHAIDTGVPLAQNVEIYVRVLDRGVEITGPYRLAAQASGR